MTTDGWPFAHSARDLVASGSRMIRLQANHSGTPCLTALCGVETSSLRSSVRSATLIGTRPLAPADAGSQLLNIFSFSAFQDFSFFW